MPSNQELFETALIHLNEIHDYAHQIQDCLLRGQYTFDDHMALGLITADSFDIRDCINEIYNDTREENTETYNDTVDNIQQWIGDDIINDTKEYILSEYIHVINIYPRYEDWCLANDKHICKLSMFTQCLCDYLDLNEEEIYEFTHDSGAIDNVELV